jgi:hypothetical protein
MLIKNILVGFFLVLFSFQLAPIQEVGAFLYNNQMTEEIPHGQDDSGMKYQDDTLKQLFFTAAVLGENIDMTGYLLSGKAADINVKTRTSDDIQTPPPNIFA